MSNCMFLSLGSDPPNVTTIEPREVIINQTQEASFTCQAYGIPTPNITWVKMTDGLTVENITSITEISESILPPTTLQSILTFVSGMKSNESVYVCQGSNGVTNVIGSPEEDNVTLLVQGILQYIQLHLTNVMFEFKYLIVIMFIRPVAYTGDIASVLLRTLTFCIFLKAIFHNYVKHM